jgi:hypothetical protein
MHIGKSNKKFPYFLSDTASNTTHVVEAERDLGVVL